MNISNIYELHGNHSIVTRVTALRQTVQSYKIFSTYIESVKIQNYVNLFKFYRFKNIDFLYQYIFSYFRCNLTRCPIIEGEEQLHLLNLQQNQIPIIENLEVFSNLKFLDLSDNLLEFISGLESCVSLRVLVLARNRYFFLIFLCMLKQIIYSFISIIK